MWANVLSGNALSSFIGKFVPTFLSAQKASPPPVMMQPTFSGPGAKGFLKNANH